MPGNGFRLPQARGLVHLVALASEFSRESVEGRLPPYGCESIDSRFRWLRGRTDSCGTNMRKQWRRTTGSRLISSLEYYHRIHVPCFHNPRRVSRRQPWDSICRSAAAPLKCEDELCLAGSCLGGGHRERRCSIRETVAKKPFQAHHGRVRAARRKLRHVPAVVLEDIGVAAVRGLRGKGVAGVGGPRGDEAAGAVPWVDRRAAGEPVLLLLCNTGR